MSGGDSFTSASPVPVPPTLPSSLSAQLHDPWYCSTNVSGLFICALGGISVMMGGLLILILRAVKRREAAAADTPVQANPDDAETAPPHPTGLFVASRCNRCNRTGEDVRALQRTLPALADMARTMQVTVMHEGAAVRRSLRRLESSLTRLSSAAIALSVDTDSSTDSSSGGPDSDSDSINSATPSTTPTACDRPGSPYALYPFPGIPPSALVSRHARFVPPRITFPATLADPSAQEYYLATLCAVGAEIGAYIAACDERREYAIADLTEIVARIDRSVGNIRDIDTAFVARV